jgi:hypothetical protein
MHCTTWQRNCVPNRSKVTVLMRYTVPSRVDWVDIAKGICIIMVVLMHSTLGVEKAVGAEGWLHALVAFARPFRIPAFFLVAGLFLARRIDQPWREYLDSKVLHFAYFYVLWLLIQCTFKCGIEAERWDLVPLHMLEGLVQPYGTLWFIYLLPVFFVATRLLREAPAGAVLAGAALLQIAPIETGWIVLDEFADRFIFFYAGYALAPLVFRFAETVRTGRLPCCWPGRGSTASRSSPMCPRCRVCRWRSGRRVPPRWSPLRSCWCRPSRPRRCAIAGPIRSSSISASCCRWRQPESFWSQPASWRMSAPCR